MGWFLSLWIKCFPFPPKKNKRRLLCNRYLWQFLGLWQSTLKFPFKKTFTSIIINMKVNQVIYISMDILGGGCPDRQCSWLTPSYMLREKLLSGGGSYGVLEIEVCLLRLMQMPLWVHCQSSTLSGHI